jgi:carboxypeptidase C (cathepsin A)
LLFSGLACLAADDASKKTKIPAPKAKNTEKEAAKNPVEVQGKIEIDGKAIAYTARTGTLTLKNGKGKDRATIFYMAYIRNDVDDKTTRPVTFCFNGGPGSSSVWLHLGAFGPRKVKMNDDGTALSPPAVLEDNPLSILDSTDLIFIDPVSTGYSRPAEGTEARSFHGYDEDLESVADFIRLYVTQFERWGSPKFLAGESYGTIRAAGLSNRLQSKYGMYLNGIVLVSTVLDFQTLSAAPGNDLPHISYLPTYAATAWFHQQLDKDLQKMSVSELAMKVRNFAETDYAAALMAGDRLSSKDHSRIVKELARYTSLPESVIEANNLRVGMSRYAKELLRDQRRTVGRFDGRYRGVDHDWGNDRFSYDASFTAIHGPISTSLNDYLRRELKYKSELPYEILTGHVQPWNYGRFKNRYLNVSGELRTAMATNPHLKVFVASGYYDLATPFAGADYTMAHLGLPKELQSNVTTEYYEGGHMMYLRKQCLQKMRRDLVRFIDDARPPKNQ